MPVTATKPGQVVKKELTPTQAEEQWIKADDRMAKDKVLKAEAAAVIEAHITKKKLSRFKRLEMVCASPSRVLDQSAVKTYLGKKIDRFMTWTNPSPRLARVKETDSS